MEIIWRLSVEKIITGSNRGIGLETAQALLTRHGGRVVLACRDVDAGRSTISDLDESAGDKAALMRLDLANFASIRTFSDEVLTSGRPVRCLINNTHLSGLKSCDLTGDLIERTFQTNHLGHFLLTLMLLPALRKSEVGRRVIHISNRT